VVEGNHRVDAEAITAHFHLGSEEAPRAAALDTALKALYATGEFEDVRIIQENDHLIVRVVEAPVIGRLQFEGNRLLKDADLANSVRLKPNAFLTKAAVQADAARIIEIYHRQGRCVADDLQSHDPPHRFRSRASRSQIKVQHVRSNRVLTANTGFPGARSRNLVPRRASGGDRPRRKWRAFPICRRGTLIAHSYSTPLPPISGLPEIGTLSAQVGQARLALLRAVPFPAQRFALRRGG
jgi:hypothetical protein